jgi:hypothetical protein
VNTSRITFNTAGLYLVTGCVEIGASAAGTKRYAFIMLNGTTVIGIASAPFATVPVTWISVSTVYKFAAGNYVELKAHQDSGGNLTLFADPQMAPEFSATWIGLG